MNRSHIRQKAESKGKGMNYKSFNLEDWIGHISEAIEDERELDGNEMRDFVEFLSGLPKWIPVSEKLPENGGCYLVIIKWKSSFTGKVYTEINMAVYKEKLKAWSCDDVVEWMPIPQLWEIESEE